MKQRSNQDTRLAKRATEDSKNPNILDSINQLSLGFKQVLDQWSQTAQEFRRQIEQIGKAATLAHRAFDQKAKEIRAAIDNFLKPISEAAQWIKNLDPVFIEAVKQKLEQIVSDTKHVHLKLAKRGWFLIASEKIPAVDMINLVICLEVGPEKVDEFMAKWVEEKLPAIQEILVNKYPLRKGHLEDAFWAYNEGRYTLAIPAFLQQADGIYIDLTGYKGGVYSKKKEKGGKTQLQCYIDNLEIQMELFYLFEPLQIITPLNADDGNVEPGLLCRHAVMHGKAYDATKLNSLRAISWLLYIGTFLDDIQDRC